jgi:hypothetical protein
MVLTTSMLRGLMQRCDRKREATHLDTRARQT